MKLNNIWSPKNHELMKSRKLLTLSVFMKLDDIWSPKNHKITILCIQIPTLLQILPLRKNPTQLVPHLRFGRSQYTPRQYWK
jgi:hypothetical protein